MKTSHYWLRVFKWKNSIAEWFSDLAMEISNSPLGAIGLFIGTFGLFLALLTSWQPLIAWLAKYWINVGISICMAIGLFWLLARLKKIASQENQSERLSEAYRVLERLSDSKKPAPLFFEEAKKGLQILLGENTEQVLDELKQASLVELKLDGRLIINQEEENAS